MPSFDHRLGFPSNIELVGGIKYTTHLFTHAKVRYSEQEQEDDKRKDIWQMVVLNRRRRESGTFSAVSANIEKVSDDGMSIVWTSDHGHGVTKRQIKAGALWISREGNIRRPDCKHLTQITYGDIWMLSGISRKKADFCTSVRQYQIIPGNIHGL